MFCVQETKCSVDQIPKVCCVCVCVCLLANGVFSPKDKLEVEGYHVYWNSAEKAGYSGVG